MKKVFLLVLISLATNGCAVRTSRGTVFFLQRGVVLQLTHTCTDRAMVYQAGRGLIGEVVGATPADFPLHPVVLSERYIPITVQSISAAGRVAETFTEQFYIDSNSTTTQTWNIGKQWSGGGGKQSQCSR